MSESMVQQMGLKDQRGAEDQHMDPVSRPSVAAPVYTAASIGLVAPHHTLTVPRWLQGTDREGTAYYDLFQTVSIVLGSTTEMRQTATGPLRISIAVPTGIRAALLATDSGFHPSGYEVRIVESAKLHAGALHLQFAVAVWAPAARDELPLTVMVVPRGVTPGAGRCAQEGQEGQANQWVKLVTTVPTDL